MYGVQARRSYAGDLVVTEQPCKACAKDEAAGFHVERPEHDGKAHLTAGDPPYPYEFILDRPYEDDGELGPWLDSVYPDWSLETVTSFFLKRGCKVVWMRRYEGARD